MPLDPHRKAFVVVAGSARWASPKQRTPAACVAGAQRRVMSVRGGGLGTIACNRLPRLQSPPLRRVTSMISYRLPWSGAIDHRALRSGLAATQTYDGGYYRVWSLHNDEDIPAVRVHGYRV
jgi:hypothetical protein